MKGWVGKILYVDLSERTWRDIETEPYSKEYIGGRGVATRIYFEEVEPGVGAFDPRNILVFMTGPLVGTGVQGANRMVIVGKSAFTFPEVFCYGNFGGLFPSTLKSAGYDGIVLKGCASEPVYLLIDDGKVKILDASFLWGRNVSEVERLLEAVHGKGLSFLSYGIAGENLVRSAVIAGTHGSSAAGGLASVMASKRLKAIVARGSGKIYSADPARLKELNRYTARMEKKMRFAIPPKVVATGRANLIQILGKARCRKCGIACVSAVMLYGGRLKGPRKCQAMEYYLPWMYGKESEPLETFFDAPTLANDYSLCTFELESVVEWLYECYREGVFSEGEVGLPLSKIGTREFLLTLLRTISQREGFGDVIAEGLSRASRLVKEEAAKIMQRTGAVPISRHVYILRRELGEARTHLVNMLLYQMEPRRHRPVLHHGFAIAAWNARRMGQDSPVDGQLLRRIAKTFWGSELAADDSTYEGKALAALKEQNRTYMEDSLGLCDWAFPLTYSFSTEDHMGNPFLEAELFSAVTGMPFAKAVEELEAAAERTVNLQRRILLMEGWATPESDIPPDLHFEEPLEPYGPFGGTVAPGPDGEPIDLSGTTLDRERFIAMLREYYALRGWNDETGIPEGIS